MAERHVKKWYDSEDDFLEGIFDSKPEHFRKTSNDHVMEKVDGEGNILGFSADGECAEAGALEVAL